MSAPRGAPRGAGRNTCFLHSACPSADTACCQPRRSQSGACQKGVCSLSGSGSTAMSMTPLDRSTHRSNEYAKAGAHHRRLARNRRGPVDHHCVLAGTPDSQLEASAVRLFQIGLVRFPRWLLLLPQSVLACSCRKKPELSWPFVAKPKGERRMRARQKLVGRNDYRLLAEKTAIAEKTEPRIVDAARVFGTLPPALQTTAATAPYESGITADANSQRYAQGAFSTRKSRNSIAANNTIATALGHERGLGQSRTHDMSAQKPASLPYRTLPITWVFLPPR